MFKKILCVHGVVCLLCAVAFAEWPGEIARWRLDNNANDSVGEFEGTLQNSPAFTTDAMVGSHALVLDGSQYVDCANPDGFPSGSEPRSMCAWAKTESLSGFRFVVAYGAPNTNQAMFLGMTGSTLLGGGYTNDLTVANFWETGVWHHLALTYDGTEARLYADGALVASEEKAWDLVLLRAYLGRQVNDGEYWIGTIDDIRIFDTVLSEPEIVSIFNGQEDGQCTNPNPDHNATDIQLRDAVLSWTPGEDAVARNVYFGTVWADVNEADTSNPLGVLVSEVQDTCTFALTGLLEFGQTYYWRVDEVNTAGTISKGAVYSFTTEPCAYPIKGIVATSNTVSDTDSGPEKTIDGSGLNDSDQHSTLDSDMWTGKTDGGEPAWIQYEFDKVYRLHDMWVWNYNLSFELMFGFGFKDVTVEYSTDGIEWTTLGDFQFAQATGKASYTADTVVTFSGVAARYVRLTAESAYGTTGAYGLSEVRFCYLPVRAREPQPQIDAVDVSVNTTLDWRAGREATSHEVYLGTDGNDLALVATVTDSECDPGVLDLATRYFWKVVEVNESELPSAWASDVWSFATQEVIVIDDFESYNDDIDAGTTIFDTWLDGWVNDTGSTVGYFVAPFAEQTIVHGGRQSMPLFYSNVGGVTMSEAEYTFPAQDWSVSGIKTLVLHFYGSSDNAADQMYVKINGAKVTCDNTTAIQEPWWHQWNVDLAAVGTNLAKVTSLSIGIDGNGSGLAYVDDIYLYREAPAVPVGVNPGTDHLVAYYAMDGDLLDGSGNGYDATASMKPTYVSGVFDQGIQLDGNDDYIELPLEPVIHTLTSATFAVWTNFSNEGGSWQRLFDFGSGTDNYMFLVPRVGSTGPIRYAISINGESVVTASAHLTTGWHHLAVVIDGTTQNTKIYLDGVVVGEGITTYVPADLEPTTQNWLGRSQFSSDSFYNGSLDEFRIYDRVLSQDEIHYLAGHR